MATRERLIVWIPTIVVVLFTVGYFEWRMNRAVKTAPTRELVGAASPGRVSQGSNTDGRALALAAAANSRAERAEQVAQALEARLARRDAAEAERNSPESSAAPTPSEQAEARRAQRAAFLDSLEQRFQTEPVNRAWQYEKESALQRTALTFGKSGVTLEKAECASSMCRVKLSHPSLGRPPRGALIEFLKAVHAEGSPLTQLAFNFKYEDGSTTLYGTTGDLGERAPAE